MEAIYDSVFSSVDAFVYRCRNDAQSTMEFMAGQVALLLGYSPDEIIQNKRVAYGDLIFAEDKVLLTAAVDKAIEAGESWDVTYRLTPLQGEKVWVRERGNAVYENGELAYLQGLVVSANAEYEMREKLESSLQKTGKVSADIASLTTEITGSVRELSMLSINAGIEAARSGDAGKGFAVVASEMRALANRNATLAEKITSRVADLHHESTE
ncbi:MAG: methyl-accepting chemotaxis protein [Pseudomonadota bacterium]